MPDFVYQIIRAMFLLFAIHDFEGWSLVINTEYYIINYIEESMKFLGTAVCAAITGNEPSANLGFESEKS